MFNDVNWDLELMHQDVEQAWSVFLHHYNRVVDLTVPLYPPKCSRQHKKWATKKVLSNNIFIVTLRSAMSVEGIALLLGMPHFTVSSKEFSLGGRKLKVPNLGYPQFCFLTGFRPLIFHHSPDARFFINFLKTKKSRPSKACFYVNL